VSVDGNLVASIGKGVLAFAAVSRDDTLKDSEQTAAKLLKMKLWDDDKGGKVGSSPSRYHSVILKLCVIVEVQCSRRRRRSPMWFVHESTSPHMMC
jgi:D-Tyr-tRNAtyr deacylase